MPAKALSKRVERVPTAMVQGTFVPQTRVERAVARRQAEEREEARWMDLAKAFLASPVAGILAGSLIGGAGGTVAQEPLHIDKLSGPVPTDFLEYWPSGKWKRVRWRCDFEVSNLWTKVFSIDVPLPITYPADKAHFGWPDRYAVTVEVDYAEDEIVPFGVIEARCQTKLVNYLRATGFAAGSAFGLAFGALGGAIGVAAKP